MSAHPIPSVKLNIHPHLTPAGPRQTPAVHHVGCDLSTAYQGADRAVSFSSPCDRARAPWGERPAHGLASSIRGAQPVQIKQIKLLGLMSRWTTLEADKLSGVLSLLFRSPVGPNSGLKSEPTHHFIRPCLLSKRTPALDRATQVRQFGFGLHTVHERQPASGPLQRPIRQPRFVHGLGHPATIQA